MQPREFINLGAAAGIVSAYSGSGILPLDNILKDLKLWGPKDICH